MPFSDPPPVRPSLLRDVLPLAVFALVLGLVVSWVYRTQTPPKTDEAPRIVHRAEPLKPGAAAARAATPRTITVYRPDTTQGATRTACVVAPAALVQAAPPKGPGQDTLGAQDLGGSQALGGAQGVGVLGDTGRLVRAVLVPTGDTSRLRPALRLTPGRVDLTAYDPSDGSGRVFSYAVPDPRLVLTAGVVAAGFVPASDLYGPPLAPHPGVALGVVATGASHPWSLSAGAGVLWLPSGQGGALPVIGASLRRDLVRWRLGEARPP